MNKASSVEEYKLSSSFQALRKTLLEDAFADRIDRSLAYWALPNDRRLPLAFLGRTLRELLQTSFEELSATPGIGQKKISTLMDLLERATKDHPSAAPREVTDPSADGNPAVTDVQHGSVFDPAMVSEALWEQWRATVRKHGLGYERLGRLCVSLQSVPTVIWHTPLEAYMDYSIAEMRQLKTHGEKRVRAILEVFCLVNEVLSHVKPQGHLSLRLTPKFVLPLERWMNEAMRRDDLPTPDEVRRSLVAPLLEQLHIDTGPSIARLAEGRLGVGGPPQSVRDQSKRNGVTRARIYQLLEDCAKVIAVRWPEGRWQLSLLRNKLESQASEEDNLDLFRVAVEFFFPNNSEMAEFEVGDSG